jgi:hypothetical protein
MQSTRAILQTLKNRPFSIFRLGTIRGFFRPRFRKSGESPFVIVNKRANL